MILNDFPLRQLAFCPTPLQKTAHLPVTLGLNSLYIKRDDLAGLAMGGNKARKLEYLMADALQQETDVVLTFGGPQSNHCRMTAAAARACGIYCHLIFTPPVVQQVQGNMILDRLLGARWSFPQGEQTRQEKMQQLADHYESQGLRTYQMPSGGSSPIGIMGYVRAGFELAEQCKSQGLNPQKLIIPSGSGGTQAGLLLGCHLAGLDISIIGISVSYPREQYVPVIENMMLETAQLLHVDTANLPQVIIYDEYVGEGYGMPTPASVEAMQVMAFNEGIILDPVYTAKGFAGLIDLVRNGHIGSGENVIFLHTGGTPALFADKALYWGQKGYR